MRVNFSKFSVFLKSKVLQKKPFHDANITTSWVLVVLLNTRRNKKNKRQADGKGCCQKKASAKITLTIDRIYPSFFELYLLFKHLPAGHLKI